MTAAYCRMVDPSCLPEIVSAGGAAKQRAQSVHDTLVRFFEVTGARVVNRYSAMASNASKPFQAQLIRAAGLAVPETLITNDPQAVCAFAEGHKELIFKSTSGTRSIVRILEPSDLERLHRIRWCPTQFQERVPGDDIRVHVVGARVFATAIRSAATDYRYAARDGIECELVPTTLPSEVEERCLQLADRLGLPFAGIDLRVTPEGKTYCFEVNPSPGYTYYEDATGQPISLALAEFLASAPR
ncbi:MAG: hypothetical protein HY908_18360 [Myxococcales bacterium]|nr:hypothetical protein [Myxococcales bacterium]